MSKEQPEALRLEEKWRAVSAQQAEEISRLHAENEALRAQIGQGEPVATLTMFDMRSQTGTVDLVGDWKELRVGDPLYTNTAPQQIGQGVPDGWQLVPKEPTPEMWNAVNKLDDQCAAGNYDGKGCSIEQAWDCLLASSPPAPQQKPLTDEQIAATYKRLTEKARQTGNPKFGSVLSLARAIEAAHGIGEKK